MKRSLAAVVSTCLVIAVFAFSTLPMSYLSSHLSLDRFRGSLSPAYRAPELPGW
jgi:hypothetical protein